MSMLAIEEARKVIKETIEKYGMHWNFESIDFVLNSGSVPFDNLQNFDSRFLNIRLIIQCGIESHNKADAFKIMEEIREAGVSMQMAHFVFVEVLKHKHFFSDTTERADLIKEGLAQLEKVLSLKTM